METSLHHTLKALYANAEHRTEVAVGGYRIDAVARGELVEVQQASLAALRAKVARLVDGGRRVLLVKPVVAGRTIVRLDEPGGVVTSRRRSPKRGALVDLFDDLVHFVAVFPRPGLTLEVVLCDVEEDRVARPVHRGRWRRDRVLDRRLVRVCEVRSLRRGRDLLRLLPALPPDGFTTAELAHTAATDRARAQRIAYCLHKAGVCVREGRDRRGYRYRWARPASPSIPSPQSGVIAPQPTGGAPLY